MTFDHRLLTTAAIAEGDVAVGARGRLTRHDIVDANFTALTNTAGAAGACCGRTARGATTNRETTRVVTRSASLGLAGAALRFARTTSIVAPGHSRACAAASTAVPAATGCTARAPSASARSTLIAVWVVVLSDPRFLFGAGGKGESNEEYDTWFGHGFTSARRMVRSRHSPLSRSAAPLAWRQELLES